MVTACTADDPSRWTEAAVEILASGELTPLVTGKHRRFARQDELDAALEGLERINRELEYATEAEAAA